MNLLFTFQAKRPQNPDPPPKIPEKASRADSTKASSNLKTLLPPISLSNSKSVKVLPYLCFDRQNLKTNLGVPRPKINDKRPVNSSSSSIHNQFHKDRLNKIFEKNEPATPTFQAEDSTFKDLVKLNEKIGKEYKKSRGRTNVVTNFEEDSGTGLEKPGRKEKFRVADFPFFLNSARNGQGDVLTDRRAAGWEMKRESVKRRHPKIQKCTPGLPHGVFTVREL